MAFQNRRGDGGGQVQRQPQQMTTNQKISFEEAFKGFVGRLNEYRPQVEAVLPSTVSFERFRAVVVMAIRRSPDLLDCDTTSLINACLYSAHDGLMPDGREAVIVKVWNEQAKRHDASYRSMVFGLIKQIIGSKAATKVQPFIVYGGEAFDILGGSDAKIIHRIEPDGSKRGDPVGAYAIAGLSGGDSTFAYMTVEQIEKIRKIAQTDKVWSKHWEEMALKTVIRRLRKRLAGTEDVPDIEERLMFPRFAGEPAPALSGAIPPRPTRAQFDQRSIEHSAESGVAMDFGADARREPVEASRASATDRRGETARPAEKRAGPVAEETIDFDAWRNALVAEIPAIAAPVDVNSRWSSERPMIERAPSAIANAIDGAFNDRLVELTAAGSSRAAEPRQDDAQDSAGENA